MTSIVLGSFFGDEGKGQAVHNLCKCSTGSTLVVRFSGGHQVGHTVRHNDVMHTFSNFGSGTLLGVPTYWSKYCTVDPNTATLEAMDLVGLGVKPEIYYSPLCQVVIPYDVYSQVNNAENLRHGTVGTGYKACLDRVRAGYSITAADCTNLYVLREKINAIADNYYHVSKSDLPMINLDKWCKSVYAYFNSVSIANFEYLQKGFNNLIFEGSQGILLDQTHGIMPYCTPSNTTSQNAFDILRGTSNRDSVSIYYVTRPYITRHGNGPFPSDKAVRPIVDPNNQFNDFQKSIRAIDFDMDLLHHSVNIDKIYHPANSRIGKILIVTHWDEATEEEKKLLYSSGMVVSPMIFDKVVNQEV